MAQGERERWPWLTADQDGANTIVGVVDLGIDTSHPALRGAVGAVWDMQATRDDGGEDPPARYRGRGRVFRGSDLRYRRDPWQHGTAVAAIAAGRGSYIGVAPACEVRVVCGSLDATDVAHGVQWIFDEARCGQAVVVNLSTGGLHNDLHNGLDPLSMAIDLIAEPGRYICVAAGNEGEIPLHVDLNFSNDKTFLVPLVVENRLGSRPENSEIAVICSGLGPWPPNLRIYRHEDANTAEVVELRDFPPRLSDKASYWNCADGRTVSVISRLARTTGRTQTLVTISPVPQLKWEPNYWTFELSSVHGLRSLNLWGSDSRVGFWNFPMGPNGLKQRSRYQYSSNRTMLGRPASARRVLTAGSYDEGSEPSPSAFSNGGKTLDRRRKPELLMPGNAPKHPDFSEMKDGTSFAVSRLSGAVALLAQKRSDLHPETLQGFLADHCRPLDTRAPWVDLYGFDYVSGFGILDLQAALQNVDAT